MANARTVALARVSSKAQEDEGYSLDAQLKMIRKYCQDNRMTIVSEFRISETASKNDQRNIFREMLGYINKNNITHLVVEKTDRLTRNLRDAVVVDDWLEANERRRLHMVKENLVVHKHAKSDEKLMWNIYLAFAKKYTDNLREEAMKGWDEKLAQGWMPAPPPPGYKTVTENSKKIHVINEDTAPLIEQAFKRYLEPNQTIAEVADELAACGLVTRNGRPLKKSQISVMLRNPFYVGTIRFNGKEYPGAHEPLINAKLFCAVQDKLSSRHSSKSVKHDPLFKGQIVCRDCGGMVTWQLQKGRYYGACQRHNSQCKSHRLLRQDYLENLIQEELRTIDEKDTIKKIFHHLEQKLTQSRQPYVGQHRVGVMMQIQRQIQRSEHMEDNLYEDKIAGAISEHSYQEKREEIRARLAQLRIRLHRLNIIEGQVKPGVVTAASIKELYESESKQGRRLILANLFKFSLNAGRVNIEYI